MDLTQTKANPQHDLDEVESTRTEKALAIVVAVFLLIGGGWLYWEIGHWLPGYPDNYSWPRPNENTGNEVSAALIRLAVISLWLSASIVAVLRLRARNSRFLPLATAAAVVGAIGGLTFAQEYSDDFFGAEFAPLAISLLGLSITGFGFWRLQRYLVRQGPARRVRKNECPRCGYPVRGDGSHCEGCGHTVRTTCRSCEGMRRVGAKHCVTCGAV